MKTILQMMVDPPRHPDWTDALGAWIAADEKVGKAQLALEKAEQAARQREAELQAVYERLTGEADDG